MKTLPPHARKIDDLTRDYGVDPKVGLSQMEVEALQKKYGPNRKFYLNIKIRFKVRSFHLHFNFRVTRRRRESVVGVDIRTI